MIRLHINVDHVATLRNARGTRYPDPVFAAQQCEAAGADGITMHLREDRRHILDADVERARQCLTTLLNLELAATEEMIQFAERIGPDVVTLVPERREERTTEGGLDVLKSQAQIRSAREMCGRRGIKLSLFIEPDENQIRASRELGAEQIELHTGRYADTQGQAQAQQLERLAEAARSAHECGLEVAAGHGLTRHNVTAIARIAPVAELNIGHAVIADAVILGLPAAVRAYREAVLRGTTQR